MKGDESAKERGLEIIKGCFIFGILLSLAPSIVSFLTNQDVSNLSTNPFLPSGLGAILEKIILMIQTLGAVLIMLGLIYGGYQYSMQSNKIINSLAIVFSILSANILNLIYSFIFYTLALSLDLISTRILIRRGGKEGNPIMKYFLNRFDFIKASFLVILLWEIPGILILSKDLSIFFGLECALVIILTLLAICHSSAAIQNWW